MVSLTFGQSKLNGFLFSRVRVVDQGWLSTSSMTASNKLRFKCSVDLAISARSTVRTSGFVRCRRRMARTRMPMVPWVAIPRFPAARRAAVSSVSSRFGRCSSATRNASHSPVCRLRTWASASRSGGAGTLGETRRSSMEGWVREPGRCWITSCHTASGTSTSEKSDSRSRQPNSSKWISGPASHTTKGIGWSVATMQAPLHITHHHGLRDTRRVRLQKTTQGIRQQLIEIGGPPFLDKSKRTRRQFRRQFSLNGGLGHNVSIARRNRIGRPGCWGAPNLSKKRVRPFPHRAPW